MPISISDAPDTLPAKAKRIYVAAWNAAYSGTCKDRSDKDECASKIAWSAVKTKFKKEGETWVAKKSETEGVAEFSMYIDKAVYNKETQELRWHCVASDTDDDSYKSNMTLELFQSFLSRIESGEAPKFQSKRFISEYWNGGMPYMSISHYSDQNGKAVPGDIKSVYVDGKQLKSSGIFHKTPLGWACFDAINKDKSGNRVVENAELDHPVRISIAFLDYKHRHKSNGKIFVRESLDDICPYCLLDAVNGENEGKEYLDGHLIHEALTRVPVNKRTNLEVEMSVTRKDDAKSIVGELAEKVDENELQTLSEAVVTRSEEPPVVELMEDKDEEEEKKKKKKVEEDDEEEMEKKSHVLQAQIDQLLSIFDEVQQANISTDEKLRNLQPAFDDLATVARSAIEGVSPTVENQAINELKSQIASLTQQIQILSQAVQEKSNVQDTQVPQPRNLRPQVPVQPFLPAQEHTGLNALIRKSVGLST